MSYRDKLLHGLFTTALEGGINYWAEVDQYHWNERTSIDDLHGFYATITEIGDGEDNIPHRIDRAVMSKGYGLAVGEWRTKIAWSTGEPPPLVVTEESYDDWDYDAGDADCILQLGLFGDVVYG